ncbi:IS110 family transposase [Plesiocystis pacifica]|uniref:IS110 family transposase n=1 Tax=Plesiocystis pacifica TaxID=191768 RepID=UPI0012FC600C|nr:IS110 family transposase [Plesiocystis pacifica]
MSKRKYRATKIQGLDLTKLSAELDTGRVIVAIDVAKEDFYAAIVNHKGQVLLIVKWIHPAESRTFLALVEHLGGPKRVEVVMEPSGVYGDAIRAALDRAGVAVFRVNPKRVHDAAEVFDGVPSLHDAKSATLIAKLHLGDISEPWPLEPEHQRRLAAVLRVLEVHEKEVGRNRNRLEGLLARHWPGASSIMSMDSATMLETLIEFGGPAALVEREDEARELMRRVGGNFLAQDKIDKLIESAHSSLGVPQLDEELELVSTIASECRRHQKAAKKARAKVEKLALLEGSATKAMAPVVGKATSAVLVAGVGCPTKYDCPASYVKALGLNLKEKSSGKSKGGLHITKRGPGIARLFLYLAVLRLIQRDRIVRAWYAKKVSRDAGRKQKALIALMRKLVSALWHVAHGAVFDSKKLFDVSRLKLAPTTDEVPQPST